jgi:DNA sulfur modification protein DndD
MHNYGVFRSADFTLHTTPDRPLILITANNGGGKTSTLTAFRLALHGRRAFDVPIGEREYMEGMEARFHNGDTAKACSLELDFDFVDHHSTRSASVVRRWVMRRKRIAEELELRLDGKELSQDDAEDLLTSTVPPEVARYFFFDGEHIRELADWDSDAELALFDAVSDLLGIQLIDQLIRDLQRVHDLGKNTTIDYRDLAVQLPMVRERAAKAQEDVRKERARGRKLRATYDRARLSLRRMN